MPDYKRLWLLVEGADDRRFAQGILLPAFRSLYDDVRIWEYSQQTNEKKTDFLKSIHSMQADYLWFCDIDDRPCISLTKQLVIRQLASLSLDRIIVVVREIEAWYLAGLDESDCQELGLQPISQSDQITKERFNLLIGGENVHTQMMVEILRRYDLEVARQKSSSFDYLLAKHCPTV